jgi:hypothetical protein
MTTAEALAGCRLLAREVRSGRLANEADRDLLLATICELLEDGIDPVIALRIRRLKRRAEVRRSVS